MKSCIPVCVIAIGVLKSRCFQTQVSTFCYSSFLRRLFMVNILRNDFSWVHQPWKQSITCNKFIFCFDNHCLCHSGCRKEVLYILPTLRPPFFQCDYMSCGFRLPDMLAKFAKKINSIGRRNHSASIPPPIRYLPPQPLPNLSIQSTNPFLRPFPT